MSKNAYLIQEDGESKVWIADTMSKALDEARGAYLDERIQDEPSCDPKAELEYYESDILQSCALVGEVGEPVQKTLPK